MSQNPMHVMLDIETAGTAPDAVILSIGAVVFDRDGRLAANDHQDVLHVGSQIAAGRTVDQETLHWWQQQDPETRHHAFSGQVSFVNSLARLSDLLGEFEAPWIWCKGASFDFPILAHAYRSIGRDTPWHFRREMDARSLYRLTGIKPSFAGRDQHDALVDAIAQAEAVHEALDALDAWDRFDTTETANAPV